MCSPLLKVRLCNSIQQHPTNYSTNPINYLGLVLQLQLPFLLLMILLLLLLPLLSTRHNIATIYSLFINFVFSYWSPLINWNHLDILLFPSMLSFPDLFKWPSAHAISLLALFILEIWCPLLTTSPLHSSPPWSLLYRPPIHFTISVSIHRNIPHFYKEQSWVF